MNDDISVIIPTFKRSFLFKQCLESIMTSTVFPLEIIICDDSDDNSCKKVVDSIDNDRIKYIRCGGKGQGNARNIGASKAAGEYLLFIDSDVILARNTISILKNNIQKNRDILIGNIMFPDIPISHYNSISDLGFFFSQIKDEHTDFIRFLPCLLMIRKRLFLKNNGFDPDFSGYGFEDIELGYRMSGTEKNIYFAKDAIAIHYNNRDISGIIRRGKNIAYASLLFFRKHPEYYNPYLIPVQDPELSTPNKHPRPYTPKEQLKNITFSGIKKILLSKIDKLKVKSLKVRLDKKNIIFMNKISYYEITFLSAFYNVNLKILPDNIISRFLSKRKKQVKNLYRTMLIDNRKKDTIDYYCSGIKKDLIIPGSGLFLLIDQIITKIS